MGCLMYRCQRLDLTLVHIVEDLNWSPDFPAADMARARHKHTLGTRVLMMVHPIFALGLG
jgi:hypothetical protein